MHVEEVARFLLYVVSWLNEASNNVIRLLPQCVIRIMPTRGHGVRLCYSRGMASNVIRYAGMLIGNIPDCMGTRMIGNDDRADVLRMLDAG
jgi:hypothetical protein